MRRSKNRPPPWQPFSDFVYVDVQRLQATTQDTSFGEDDNGTWTTVYSNLPCHFDSSPTYAAGGLNMTEAGQLSLSDYLMVFDPGYTVKSRDRIVDIDGNIYAVMNVRPYATHKEAYCKVAEID